MTLSTIHWDIDIVAQSSIVHREIYTDRNKDSFTLFRRETVISPDGQVLQIPVVSGGSFRGVLRRIGEALTAGVLNYEDSLPVPAAHLLTNGGRLAKSAHPLTDEEERNLKALLPQVAVFGGAASGRIMEGLLKVSKVWPEVAEAAHLLPRKPPNPLRPAVFSVADEYFTHLPDHRPTTAHAPLMDSAKTSPLGRFGTETLPAGTRLQAWAHLENATEYQAAFVRDVLAAFAARGHLGGRRAAGHGQVSATMTATAERGDLPSASVDWVAQLANDRDAAIAALTRLT